MAFSDNMQEAASRLLSTYGELISVSRPNIITINPLTGVATEGAPTSYSGYGHPTVFDVSFIDNVLVFKTDIRLLFYSSTEPLNGDIFTLNSVEYTAITVQNKRAQGENIYYVVQLRQ